MRASITSTNTRPAAKFWVSDLGKRSCCPVAGAFKRAVLFPGLEARLSFDDGAQNMGFEDNAVLIAQNHLDITFALFIGRPRHAEPENDALL